MGGCHTREDAYEGQNLRERGEQYYNRTLRLFIFGIGISFLGALIDMASHFLLS